MKKLISFILFLVVLIFLINFIPVKPIIIKGRLVFAEVAKTAKQKAKGLQRRLNMEENHGMLFVFEVDCRQGFWMKDTLLPLSIAFIDKNRNIVDIQEMKPQPDDLIYSPSQNFKYALEMNSGWFEKNGIKTGDKVWFY